MVLVFAVNRVGDISHTKPAAIRSGERVEEAKLVPREVEKIALHNAGFLAQKRLARGLRLNYTEAVALIATQVCFNPILMASCSLSN
ncbi:hypothetical protein BHE74_00044304 [Ensete ventricosum]|uniref:Uncharacterized protein n=1 Tax=Ensete ventricosum TaxID=4639 RepID=A0A444CGF3_ENSVE|nr:hypothetical protein B296_00038743 [Ensete ventricosum]RWV84911.1 hypothetical protein GW17_00053341 [Ensete ventricosum]RWW49518.1 hypothetical protein BHE74_00044304 [Ensete ventricosum]RZS15430.1 hypothetical protein BHM03_00047268 [Ensete ventricosum]